jgi:hypothetical protein
MKHLCLMVLLAGFAVAVTPAYAAFDVGASLGFSDVSQGLRICPKVCTTRADCAEFCIAFECDIIRHKDGSTCSCEQILKGGPCPQTPPINPRQGGGVNQQ